MDKIARQVLDGYGLSGYTLLPPQKGYRNQSFPMQFGDGSTANLILYKRESGMLARIRRANRVADYVYGHGLPARHTLRPQIARLAATCGEAYAALYEYLPGHTIPWEAYTQKHIKLLGKTLSDLHAALQDFDAHDLPSVVGEYEQIMQRMRLYFMQAGVQSALMGKLQLSIKERLFVKFEALLQACEHLPDQQALHMDFVRSNILFGENTGEIAVTGILDFEKTAYGSPLFDIARTLAFLLVDCKYESPDRVRKYFLHSGYQKRGAATFKNIAVKTPYESTSLLELLIDLFLFYDFYKFLRHNPYEYLPQNEHFVRTRDTLCQRGLLAANVANGTAE